MTDTTTRRSALAHPMAKFFVFVMALFVVWAVAWFAVAAFLDARAGEAIERAEARGLAVTCADREVVGFPFRFGLACSDVALLTPDGARITAGPLRSAAQFYDLTRHVAELGAPLDLSGRGLTAQARWKTLRVFADATMNGGFERLSLTGSDWALTAPIGDLQGDELVLHARPAPGSGGDGSDGGEPNGDLDIAARVGSLTVRGGDAVVPAFSALLQARIDGAYAALRSRRGAAGLVRPGARIDIEALRVALGARGLVALAGPLTLEEDGTVSGTLKLGVEEADDVVAYLTTVDRELEGPARAVAQGVASLGQLHDFAGRSLPAIDLTIERGRARLGFIPLGTIPPIELRQPPSS